jgi:hypothetical protein
VHFLLRRAETEMCGEALTPRNHAGQAGIFALAGLHEEKVILLVMSSRQRLRGVCCN